MFKVDTILLFFGDHQPNIEILHEEEYHSKYSKDEVPYMVPFMIYANYDIEEKSDVEISTNYLQSMLYETAKILLNEMYKEGTPIRLVGLRVSNLIDQKEEQLSLFQTNQDEKQKEIDKTLDKIKEKYGYQSITRAGEMNVKGMLKWNKL